MTKELMIHKENDPERSLYIIFTVMNKLFALPIEQISEIIQLPEMDVPNNAPPYLAGLINLRGQIITAIDPYPILGSERSVYKQDNLVIVTSFEEGSIGLVVDAIIDTVNFDINESVVASNPINDPYIDFVSMWESNLIYFLNLGAFLKKAESESFEDYTNKEKSFKSLAADEASASKFKKRAAGLSKVIKTDVSIAGYNDKKYVLFSLNNEIYGVNLKSVKEFCKENLSSVVPVPCTPKFIIGVYNLRGEFITVIDIKPFLGIVDNPVRERVKFIVINSDCFKVAVIVDDILDIDEIAEERKLTVNNESSAVNKYISSELIWDDERIASILDVDRLLKEENIFVEDAV